jgi:hypothetical protein
MFIFHNFVCATPQSLRDSSPRWEPLEKPLLEERCPKGGVVAVIFKEIMCLIDFLFATPQSLRDSSPRWEPLGKPLLEERCPKGGVVAVIF